MTTSGEAAADRGSVRRQLLIRFMAEAPFQPATNFWRAIELPELASSLPKAGRGLDIGCGNGMLTGILRDLVDGRWELVGVDPDPAEAAPAARSGQYQRVHTTGANRIPEADGSFDFAFANSVLEHVPDLPPVLAETARCLKPRGLFVATVPSAMLHGLMQGPGFFRRQSRAEYLAETDRRLAHFQYPTMDQWQQLFDEVGFEMINVRGYLTGRQVRRWEKWTNRTGGLLYRLRGRKRRPIEMQRAPGLRHSLPRPLRFLSHPAAWVTAYGVIDDDSKNPAETGCLLLTARKRA
jgi:SAM-dependent methyltransferase